MPIQRVGNPAPPRTALFPQAPVTTLDFLAIASTANARVNVTYTIRSPGGARFANGTTTDTLLGAPVAVNPPTNVSKAVRFANTTNPAPIVIDGAVTDLSGGPGFPNTWIVPVQITPPATNVALANVVEPSDVSTPHPASEAAALIRQLHALLPELDAMASASERDSDENAKDRRKSRPKRRPKKPRDGGGP